MSEKRERNTGERGAGEERLKRAKKERRERRKSEESEEREEEKSDVGFGRRPPHVS